MSEYIFTASEFADKCLALAREYKTVYALGMWGWKLTREGIDAKAKQLPSFYTAAKKAALYKLADAGGYWGFDCVCMIKALLWGWGSDLSGSRGGAKYASNGVPDFGADSIGKYCEGFTDDFSHIEVGEALRMPGHVGVYVGDGLAVECTAAWEGKVMITAVGNIGKKAGYHTRTWTEHGKLKWINYNEEDQPMTADEKKAFEALATNVATLQRDIAELQRRNDELNGIVEQLKIIIATQGESVDSIVKKVAEQGKQLKVYHYWSEIKKELPWAYKPLHALYGAGLFAGESASDLNVCRVKIETLVSLAAALKMQGVIKY